MKNRLTFSRLILSLLAFQTILFFYVFFQQKSRLAQPQPPRPRAAYTCQKIKQIMSINGAQNPSQRLAALPCAGTHCPESLVYWTESPRRSHVEISGDTQVSKQKKVAHWNVIAIEGAGVKAERHGAIPEIKVRIEKTKRPVSLYLSNKKSVVWNIINPSQAPIERVILLSDAPSWLTGLKEGSSFEWLGTRQGCRQAWAADDELNPEAEFDFMMTAFAAYTGAERAQFMGSRFGDSFVVRDLPPPKALDQDGDVKLETQRVPSSLSQSESSSGSRDQKHFEWNGRVSISSERYVQESKVFQFDGQDYQFNYLAPGATIQPRLTAVERALSDLKDAHHIFRVEESLIAADRNGLHAFETQTGHFLQVVSWDEFKVKDMIVEGTTRNTSDEHLHSSSEKHVELNHSSEARIVLLVSRENQLSELNLPVRTLQDAIRKRKVLNQIDVAWTQKWTEPRLKRYPEYWSMKYAHLDGKRGLRIFKPQNLKGEFVLLSGATDLSASSAQNKY